MEFSSAALVLQQGNKDHNRAFYAAKVFLTDHVGKGVFLSLQRHV